MTWDFESQNLDVFLNIIWAKFTEISYIIRNFDIRADTL